MSRDQPTGNPGDLIVGNPPVLLWFRQDLRLADNPALVAAAAHAADQNSPLLACFILDEDSPGLRSLGGAARWWLHHSLQALADDLAALGITLHLARGAAQPILSALVADTGARAVFWNRCYEPGIVRRDKAIKQALITAGCVAHSFNSALLWEPWDIANGQGRPFQVFTPFWRSILARGAPPLPLPRPEAPIPSISWPGESLGDWGLLPVQPDWAGGLRDHWRPGEAGAWKRWDGFVPTACARYQDQRDRPDIRGTSGLSPHLHWGEISPRQLWHAVPADILGPGTDTFLKEVGWREFSYHLLYHRPELPERNLRPEFDAFPWQENAPALAAWQRGRTGYPIIDAGMAELWATGWMHNRVRMIAASFLIKDLLIDWRAGEAWFWDTLVDADLASNTASWQWVAGSGADAAPFFRIFNPILQGEKFDPEGRYVRHWLPALARLPDRWIHQPFAAPSEVLRAAGITLGVDYPHPLVDHGFARDRALAAFKQIKA